MCRQTYATGSPPWTQLHICNICDRARAMAHVMPAAGVSVEVSTYNCVMAACRVPPTRVVPVSFCILHELLLCFGCDWLAEILFHWQCQQTPVASVCIKCSGSWVLGCASKAVVQGVCRVCLPVCTLLTMNPRLLLGTKVPIMTPNKVNFPVYSFARSPSV